MSVSIESTNCVRVLVTLVTALVLSLVLMPHFIRLIERLKLGQEIRKLGPEAHLKKQGTPTMGGAVFLASSLAALLLGSLISGGIEADTLKIVFLSLSFGLIGAADDLMKIRKHDSDGLSPLQKIAMQLVLSLIFILWVYHDRGGGYVLIPFSTRSFSLGLTAFVPFSLLVILGTDNGVNFTDGLDGLCASVTAVVAAMFVLLGLGTGRVGISISSAAFLGGLLGFLFYNAYPASIFMGDTGSLALGGYVAGTALVSATELYVPIYGFIYLIEVLSVIIQVSYFKASGGKRIFRMSPIHHHFELGGYSETRIVTAFGIITLILAMISWTAITFTTG